MKRLLLAAIIAMATSGPAWAQSSTASGMGVGVAGSTSMSQAISGQGGTGVGVVAPGGIAPSATINSNTPANQTVKNVPSVFSPGLAAAGLETCLGSVSGGGAFVGTGFSFGTTIPDPGCAARLDARTLWSMGLKKAAVARLCLNPDIYRAMPEVCGQYLPQPAPVGYPAPPPIPTRYAQAEASDDEQPYTGGDIWLVEGATGKNRLCNDYDVTQQRCRVWAHTVHQSAPKKAPASWAHTVHHSAPKKKAPASSETSHTAASPAPAPAVPETEKKEKSQVERIERVDLRDERLLPSLALYNHRCSSLPLLPFLGPCAARTVFATTTM
jgi:hypothetical protein